MHPRDPFTRALSMRLTRSELFVNDKGPALNLFVFQHVGGSYTAVAEKLTESGVPSGAHVAMGSKLDITLVRRHPTRASTLRTHRAWIQRELYAPLARASYRPSGQLATAPLTTERWISYGQEELKVKDSTFWDSLDEQLARDTFKVGKPELDADLKNSFSRLLQNVTRMPAVREEAIALMFGHFTVASADGFSDFRRQLRTDPAPLVQAIPQEIREFIERSVSVCSLMSPDAPLDLSMADLLVAQGRRPLPRP